MHTVRIQRRMRSIKRILLVEDDPQGVIAAEMFFDPDTWEPEWGDCPDLVVARTAAEFEKMVYEYKRDLDVLVTDIVLGHDPSSPNKETGIDVYARVKHEIPDVPCLAITGQAPDSEAIKAIKEGVQDYIKKPFAWQDVWRRLEDKVALSRVISELRVAQQIQRNILPKCSPDRLDARVELFADIEPAEQVGGDLFDYFELPDGRVAFLLGDVAGKGVPAALCMTQADAYLRAVVRHECSPAKCLAEVSDLLMNESAMFVTLWLGLLDPATGQLTYANAGHNPTYVVRAGGSFEMMPRPAGTPLAALPNAQYAESTLAMQPGDTVVVYTDGVTEAFNASHKMFGKRGLEGFLANCQGLTPQGLVRSLFEAVHTHAAGYHQSDDICILAVQYRGA